jgi:hypothetical protein
VQRARMAAGLEPARVVHIGGIGHDVMRHRPAALSAELTRLAESVSSGAGVQAS